MPAPRDLHQLVAAELMASLANIVDTIWDRAVSDVEERVRGAIRVSSPPRGSLPGATQGKPETAQKRGARGRAAKGVVKAAIFNAVLGYPQGATRDEVRKVASNALGAAIKEGSLKQGLRLLSKDNKIENHDRLWFIKKNGGQSND